MGFSVSLFPHCFCVLAREGEKGKKSWEKPQQRPRKVEKRGKSHGFRELLFWGIIIEKVWKKILWGYGKILWKKERPGAGTGF